MTELDSLVDQALQELWEKHQDALPWNDADESTRIESREDLEAAFSLSAPEFVHLFVLSLDRLIIGGYRTRSSSDNMETGARLASMVPDRQVRVGKTQDSGEYQADDDDQERPEWEPGTGHFLKSSPYF
jgi:hypothetical protein